MGELVETSVDGHVALCRLNRPEARNALSPELMEELAGAVESFDADAEVRCIVIAGRDEVFASGADDANRARKLAHRPLNSGRRLSMKALIPSTRSSVAIASS